MNALNFKTYDFRFRKQAGKIEIYDIIRRKYVVLQPEEWVRQHVVRFLINEKGYPQALINVEKELLLNGLTKRYDVVVFATDGSIEVVVECKAPSVAITQEVFDQIARYNLSLRARYLMVTNGLNHYYCQTDYQAQCYLFLPDLPSYHCTAQPSTL